MARKIRCNDEVVVLTGKDKGKRGKVLCVLSSNKAVVTGVNVIKKHQKPVPTVNNPGGIVKKEAAIDISNLAIFDNILCKISRVGFKIKDGKKIRILKSSGRILE